MPSLNLTAKIWHGKLFKTSTLDWEGGKPGGAADLTVAAAIEHQKALGQGPNLYFQYPYHNPNYWSSMNFRLLLLPPRTDVRPVLDASPPDDIVGSYDIVQCPTDREQWYYVSDAYDIGRGHANEFRIAVLLPWYPWWDIPID